ncbi:hypothetical protein TWF694_001904 [Orbilia ellipsospora]|uniref:Golgi to ER traffic protein 2 n=1 Tax=Orbilia ellipsospora TaxID=2528407 RepID=A0AAV9X534_9PEZI
MSDSTPNVPEQTTPSDASLAQVTPLSVSEQARRRRELRKAKVGQGADRLRKITQTQRTAAGFGEDYKKDEIQTTPTPRSGTLSDVSDTDPDVSEHFYKPTSYRIRDEPNAIPPPTPPSQTEFSLDNDQIAQMMMQGGGLFGTPTGGATPGDMANDPIFMMMQQMLGAAAANGGPGVGKEGADGGGIPPELLNSMLGGGFGAGGPEIPQEVAQGSPFAKWWAVIHVLCSILLGVYAVLSLPDKFTGTKEDRLKFADTPKIPLFWYFATMELMLQSTRYLLVERGGPPPGLIMGTIVRFLPRPLGRAILTLSHYIKMFSTAYQDALIVVFTIGMTGWVNSWLVEEEVPIL